jgi:hypothetical protein
MHESTPLRKFLTWELKMERHLAKAFVEHFLALDAPLNAAAALTAQIADEAERKAIRDGIAEIGMAIYTDLIRQVTRNYPDLEPADRD